MWTHHTDIVFIHIYTTLAVQSGTEANLMIVHLTNSPSRPANLGEKTHHVTVCVPMHGMHGRVWNSRVCTHTSRQTKTIEWRSGVLQRCVGFITFFICFTPLCIVFIPFELVSYPSGLFEYLVHNFHTHLVYLNKYGMKLSCSVLSWFFFIPCACISYLFGMKQWVRWKFVNMSHFFMGNFKVWKKHFKVWKTIEGMKLFLRVWKSTFWVWKKNQFLQISPFHTLWKYRLFPWWHLPQSESIISTTKKRGLSHAPPACGAAEGAAVALLEGAADGMQVKIGPGRKGLWWMQCENCRLPIQNWNRSWLVRGSGQRRLGTCPSLREPTLALSA